MYSGQLPTRLAEHVTEISDSAFFAIEYAHHLWRARKNIYVSSIIAV
jgi:hypothetical protein